MTWLMWKQMKYFMDIIVLFHVFKRIEKDIQRILLFHGLTLNNGKWEYFQFNDDNKIKYTYSHNYHKING